MATRSLKLENLENRELLAGDLRIVELNYNPHDAFVQFGERDQDADDFEFLEIQNVGDARLALGGYRIDQGVSFQFGQQFLDVGERLVITKDLRDFRSRYGNSIRIALGNDGDGGDGGEYGGGLNNSGEEIVLRDPAGRVIQRMMYFDRGEWPSRADGQGSSLEILDPLGDANDPKNWRASGEYGGSPGVTGKGMLQDVVINELLTHTDLPQVDTIELFNPSDALINMQDWYLTDSAANPFRFRFTAGNGGIRGNDYTVLDENQLGFSFRGQEADNVFLVEADAIGRPVRFVDAVEFGATQNGVTLGRWDNGDGQLFPMEEETFEDSNTGPLIGPIVISEVQYHPAQPAAGAAVTENDLEFVELTNRSGVPLDISQWRLHSAVDFTIPDGTVVSAGSTLLIVGFNPNNDAKRRGFIQEYGLPGDVELLGPYSDSDDPNSDQLDDVGERLILDRPEDPLQLGLGYVLVDRVTYASNGDWPEAANGTGKSLTRSDLELYGDFGSSWTATTATPGRTGVAGDVNSDGEVNADDIDLVCTAANLGGRNPIFDVNGDGDVNLSDARFLVEEIIGTSIGDSNLDGRFDSGDLVQVFSRGEYEDEVPANSRWASGDWNCDNEFTTTDLVAAFQAGGYVVGAAPQLSASDLAAAVDELFSDDAKRIR